jgi:hypothetical protein
MVVLDFFIVNVALLSTATDLGAGQERARGGDCSLRVGAALPSPHARAAPRAECSFRLLAQLDVAATKTAPIHARQQRVASDR